MNRKLEDQRKAFLYKKWLEERDAEKLRKGVDVHFEKPDQPGETPQTERIVVHDPMREEMAKRNRERFPELAKFIDEVRKVFPDAKVVSIRPLTPEEKANQVRASREPPESDDSTS
jgi:hypothetical protein